MGEIMQPTATAGSPAAPLPAVNTQPINREWVTGRAVVDRRTVHVADVAAESVEYPVGSAYGRDWGHHTTLATPHMRTAQPVGKA